MASLNATGDKSFICPGCRRGGFATLGAVRAHFASKGHELLCSPCDRHFGNITAFLKHSQQHEKPIDGSDSKFHGPAMQAQKGMKQRKLGDLVDSFTPKPAESTPRNPKPKKLRNDSSTAPVPTTSEWPSESQSRTELLPAPLTSAELARKSKKSKKSQDRPEAIPVKFSGSENAEGGVRLPVTRPKEPISKTQKSRKSQDRSESVSVKPAPPATKTIFNEKAIRDLFGRSETAKDEGKTDTGPNALNANYHVTLETLEQDLIFRYLSARCHSATRLATLGFVFWDERAGFYRRSSKKVGDKFTHYRQVPRSSDGLPKRRAIVIDCEMVRMNLGQRDIAFLTAIDFLTGSVLINNYVKPDGQVVDWDSRYSGVTPYAMNKAVKEGTALKGREGARAKLWEFMDINTVLIGHSINNDLDVLGMVHPNIVDSAILTSEAVFHTARGYENLTRSWSLKALTKQLLDYDIQASSKGHSALEDARATRDVVIWCLRYPEHLKAWADNAREEVEARALEREMKQVTVDQEIDPIAKRLEEKWTSRMMFYEPPMDINDSGPSWYDSNALGFMPSARDEVIPNDELEHELRSIQTAATSFF
ncbi:Exonuclease RNase T/DNA polymerase III [Penicillium bovifimosum]|uniref:Exonuclease RNase T/DNA polymerase III n=1 Tax=Penicillium bovifimosum TaxID=126998 RepID=A0A9W9GN77_9EURO|nr:Exonuclease RNase T/DNA polymerase III [Penicillium bovifimosum]KAJ5123930.1 Exonuclease RNase T/DNA polymerase III [Penicillium bovifimosum]